MSERLDMSVVLGVGDTWVRRDVRTAVAAVAAVVADHASLDDALASAEALVPDVLVLDDQHEPGELGATCLRALLHVPATRVVAWVTEDDDPAYDALRNGAFSVVVARAGLPALRDAVRGAPRGESLLPAGCARRLLDDAALAAAEHRDPFVRPFVLTATEHEVLSRLAEGMSPGDIAAVHDVTPRLVNLHAGYAVAKLHVRRQRLHTHDALRSLNALPSL